MVRSALVEPLVAPLAGRRSRSALARSRLASTALCVSALVAVTTNADARPKAQATPAPVERRAELPVPTFASPRPLKSTTDAVRAFLVYRTRDDERAPGEAPDFDHDAVRASRRRHAIDRARGSGPGLGLGRQLDRLFGSVDRAYLRFGSGQHQSALPHP